MASSARTSRSPAWPRAWRGETGVRRDVTAVRSRERFACWEFKSAPYANDSGAKPDGAIGSAAGDVPARVGAGSAAGTAAEARTGGRACVHAADRRAGSGSAVGQDEKI